MCSVWLCTWCSMWGAVCGCECVLCVWCVVVSVGWASERDRTRGLRGWGSRAQSLGAGPLPGGLGGPSAQAGLWTFFLALDPSAMFAGCRLLVQQVLGMEEETPALPLGRIGTSPGGRGTASAGFMVDRGWFSRRLAQAGQHPGGLCLRPFLTHRIEVTCWPLGRLWVWGCLLPQSLPPASRTQPVLDS